MINFLKRWAILHFYQDRETGHLNTISSLVQRNNDINSELQALRRDVESLRRERDEAVRSERDATRKVADLFAFRLLGAPVFDADAFKRTMDKRSEKDLEEFRRKQIPRANQIMENMKNEFLAQNEVYGMEPVFNEEEMEDGEAVQ